MSESENPAIPSPRPKRVRPRTNKDWWPDQLDLSLLHQHSPLSNPMGESFDYAEAFKTLDVEALKRDYPGDEDLAGLVAGRLRPLRAALHPDDVACRRHIPHRRWPRRWRRGRSALCPAQQLARQREPRQSAPAALADQAEVRPEDFLGRSAGLRRQRGDGDMGFKTFGFGFGRADIWEPEEIFWGSEDTWLGDERHGGDPVGGLHGPFGADHMGLIYVNPEGPGGKPDPAAQPKMIRQTFGHMAMNDEETVALIVGGHTFGKTHGAAPAPSTLARSLRVRPSRQQGLGWKNRYGSGKGAEAITSGLEGAWTTNPVKWDHNFLENLYGHEWELTTSPGGAKQWKPKAMDQHNRHGARSSRSIEASRRHDAHDGPRTEDGSRLCGDHKAFPRTPGAA